jgi:site-specific DNA recombinase
MIEESSMNLFDVVVVHKYDRFARNRYDSAHYKRKLKVNGVRVESVLEQLDNSPESVILESVLEGMAEYYSKNLAREVMKGMHENADKGIHTGGRPPYGLKINKDTLMYEIDEKCYRAVQIYFEGIRDNISLSEIAKSLNKQGFRTQDGKEFSKNSFFGWARNRKYIGDYVWNVSSSKDAEGRRNGSKKKSIEDQIIKKGIIPQIIDHDLFKEVNQMMELRKSKPGKMKANINYLLTGKVFCGQCGSPYNGNSYRNSKSKENTLLSYYRCSEKCKNARIRKDNLEGVVIEQLEKQCFSEEGMKEIAESVNKLYQEKKKDYESNADPIKKKIKEIEKSVDNWINALGMGIKGLEAKIIEGQNKIEFLQKELFKIKAIQNHNILNTEDIYKVLKIKKDSLYSKNELERKKVLEEYVNRITVNATDDLDILDVEITYRVFNGGGEGICTPVSKSCHKSVYACILYFKFRRL